MSKRQAALAVVRLEDGVEDVEDGLVLEHAAVAAQREECSPRFVREAVARKAAVRTQQFGRGDVAVERARCRKGGGLEFEQHALSSSVFNGMSASSANAVTARQFLQPIQRSRPQTCRSFLSPQNVNILKY